MGEKKALIAMSGGVDSSVAAFLMQQQGYECTGVTMRLFGNDILGLDQESSCCSLDDVEDARSVARRLGMPFYVFNFTDDFEEKVISKFIRCYECGATPNPCIDCNRYLKFEHLKSLQLTKDEYPYPYRPVAVADWNSAGVKENYDVVYGWPDMDMSGISQCVFTREFGEYVDDWYAHNNLNRASRSWGEKPMLTQAYSLAKTTEEMHTPGQFIGGCQWHPFDHQRGYHPDPYWGGIFL